MDSSGEESSGKEGNRNQMEHIGRTGDEVDFKEENGDRICSSDMEIAEEKRPFLRKNDREG